MKRNLPLYSFSILVFLFLMPLHIYSEIRMSGRVTCEEVGVLGAAVYEINDNNPGLDKVVFTDLDGSYTLAVDTLPVFLK